MAAVAYSLAVPLTVTTTTVKIKSSVFFCNFVECLISVEVEALLGIIGFGQSALPVSLIP